MLEEIAKDTGKAPQALQTKPPLPLHLGFYYEAYLALSRARGLTMGGVLPIVFSEITNWANEYRIRGEDQRDRLIFFVQSLDQAYMAFLEAKQSTKNDIEPKK